MKWRQILATVSSMAIIISAFMVWVRFSTPFGDLTVTGIEGNEGYIAAAIGTAGLILSMMRSSYTILAGILGVILSIVELVDLAQSMESREMMESKGVMANIGEGIYVLMIGSLLLLVAGILMQRAR